MEEKEERILTKPRCILMCMLLIISLIATTYFNIKYSIYKIPNSIKKEIKEEISFIKDEKIICALLPFQFNIKYFNVVKSIPSFPYILVDEVQAHGQQSDGFRMWCEIQESGTSLNYILHIYNIFCIVALICLRKHIKKL